jgi:hypothetical protein
VPSDVVTLQTAVLLYLFRSACRRWDDKLEAEKDDKLEAEKTWNNLKIHFAADYRHHRQMQGETVGSQGFANAAVTQESEDDLT